MLLTACRSEDIVATTGSNTIKVRMYMYVHHIYSEQLLNNSLLPIVAGGVMKVQKI